MKITIDLDALWNLCYHSYARGARVQQSKLLPKEEQLGEVCQENFNDFFYKETTKNSLFEHMKELENKGKLKIK